MGRFEIARRIRLHGTNQFQDPQISHQEYGICLSEGGVLSNDGFVRDAVIGQPFDLATAANGSNAGCECRNLKVDRKSAKGRRSYSKVR